MSSMDFLFDNGVNQQSNDIAINKPYPKVIYRGAENGSVYYEDVEVSGVIYRAQNAKYNTFTNQWIPINSLLPANAMSTQIDGTTEFLTCAAGISPIVWINSWSISPKGDTTGLGVRSVVNVKGFGAKGDGATDDTVNVQAAATALTALGGGTLYFPPGTYLINTPGITLTTGNVNIIGAGWSSILKQYGTAFAPWGMFYGTSVNNITVQDLQFVGNNAIDPNGVSANVQALAGVWTTCNNIQYSRCKVTLTQGFAISFDGSSCQDISIDHCVFDTSGQGRPTALFMPQLFFGSGVNQTLRPSVTNCWFKDLHFHGIWLQSQDGIVDNCHFNNVGEARVVAGQRSIVTNCTDTNGWMAAVSGQFIECFGDGLVASNNQVYNAGYAADPYATGNSNCVGVFVNGGHAVVSGNTFQNCKGGGIYLGPSASGTNPGQGASVTGNTIRNCGSVIGRGCGITVAGANGFPTNGLTITGNALSGNLPYDMNVSNYDAPSSTFRGNSCWPDTVSLGLRSYTGATTLASMISTSIGAGALTGSGGFSAAFRGVFALTGAGTATLAVLFGGGAFISVGGTWLATETITYTLNGHATVYTVGSSPTLATVIAGLTAAINADATSNLLCTAAASPTGIYVVAKPAAFALGITVANSSSKASAAGTTVVAGGTFIALLLAYTTGAASTAPYELGVSVVNDNVGNPVSNVATTKTTIGSAVTLIAPAATTIDTSQPMTLALYGSHTVAGDAINNNTLVYERL